MMSDKLTFKIRDTQLPKTVEVPGIVERKEVDDPDVFTVYNQFSRENHGALQRTAFTGKNTGATKTKKAEQQLSIIIKVVTPLVCFLLGRRRSLSRKRNVLLESRSPQWIMELYLGSFLYGLLGQRRYL